MSERKRLGGDGAAWSKTRKGVSDSAPELLNRLFRAPPRLTFLAMGVAAGGLALCSINLLALFQANFRLLLTTALWPRVQGLLSRVHGARQ